MVLGPLGSADPNLCVWEGESGACRACSAQGITRGEPLGLYAEKGERYRTRLSALLSVPYARVIPAEHLSTPSAVGQHEEMAKRRFESSSLSREL